MRWKGIRGCIAGWLNSVYVLASWQRKATKLRHVCLSVHVPQLQRTAYLRIFMKFRTGSFNKIFQHLTLVVIRQQRTLHGFQRGFQALICVKSLNVYRNEKNAWGRRRREKL
jgi:hypothetical protein